MRYFCLAGNHKEAFNLKRKLNIQDITYIFDLNRDLAGVSEGILFVYGTYYDRDDYSHVLQEAEIKKFTILKVEEL